MNKRTGFGFLFQKIFTLRLRVFSPKRIGDQQIPRGGAVKDFD
jgi:hypothetical protein